MQAGVEDLSPGTKMNTSERSGGEDDQAGASNYLDNKYLVSHKYPHWAHHVSQSSPISDKFQTVPCLVL